MPIFKVLIVATTLAEVTHPGSNWTFTQESRAYSEYQYFSTLEKAKAFCEQYIRPVIDYEDTDEPPVFIVNWDNTFTDAWTTKFEIYNFDIYMEEGSNFDTLSKPPLPNDFAEYRHPSD